MYEASKILTEEVLALAGLSPAPIKTTRSLGMAVRSSVVAKAMREQGDTLLGQSQPAIQVKRTESPPIRSAKEKDSREQDFRPSGSSKRARTEKCSDEQVHTAGWVHNTEKIVQDMCKDASSSRRSRDGDIDFASSVFKSSEDTFEMYRHTLRRADQLALVDVPLIKLEDVAAHHSLATNAVIHHLLLRAAYLENELQTCKSKLNEANLKSEDRARTEFGPKLEELKKSLNDSNLKNMKLRQRLEESISRFKKLELTCDRKREESFNAGRAAGRQEFMESDEYYAAMNKTSEKTLEAFMKSKTYATAVAKSAAVYEFRGFSKCRSQSKKLGAFREEFDSDSLNPFKNENFEDYIIKDEADAEEEDEFAYLLQHQDQANFR